MVRLRVSAVQDRPCLRELWKLAFGDSDDYIDCFFGACPDPEQVLVLEEGGQVRAMTAWFDVPLVTSEGTTLPAAYLYAVATHPDFRGKGLAGALLDFAGKWLGERGYVCLTTVPARPDLHVFFARNGFEEGFALSREEYTDLGEGERAVLTPVGGETYGVLRERQLTGRTHAAYSMAALDYQYGTCALSGGGLYRVGADGCACVEVSGETVFVKELLAPDIPAALRAIAVQHPATCYQVRTPWEGQGERWDFAMLRPLRPMTEWDSIRPGYFGLAFD